MPNGDTHKLLTLGVGLALAKFANIWGLGVVLVLLAMFAGNWVMDKDHWINKHRNPFVTHGFVPILGIMFILYWALSAHTRGLGQFVPAGFALGMLVHLAADRIKDWLPLPNIANIEDNFLKVVSIILIYLVVIW